MTLIELVNHNMKMLNANYNEDDLGLRYQYYVETACEFQGTKEELIEIIKAYGQELKEYILTNQNLVDVIMQKDRINRHDLNISDEVNFDKVLQSLFENQELTGYEERAQHVLLLEAMNMYNTYGLEELRTNKEIIKKELDYGIYYMKTDPNRNLISEREDKPEVNAHSERNFEEIMRLGDKYGKDTLPYIQNLELLQKRIDSLINIIAPEVQEDAVALYETVSKIIEAKNDPQSTLTIDVDLLEQVYASYDKINILTLKHNMSESIPPVIDKPTGELLMLHFIQDGSEIVYDKEMNSFLQEEILLAAKRIISEAKGQPYNEETDYKILQEILKQYQASRENPADLGSRIPLRCKYIGKSAGFTYSQVITKPTTLLSVSISAPENINAHLDRRIAIGFLPNDIPVEAIVSTSKRFNSEKDRIEFSRGKYSIAEMMKYSSEENNTNETLVDWTQIKPGYILVVKDKEILEENILARAEQLAKQNNLPLVVYDSYAIKQNTNGNGNYTNTNSNSQAK